MDDCRKHEYCCLQAPIKCPFLQSKISASAHGWLIENLSTDPTSSICDTDYFDKAEEESRNVVDIKYQEEVWQEIERKQMQHFYMADWTTSIPLKILWHGFNLSHHITQNTSPLFCSKIKP